MSRSDDRDDLEDRLAELESTLRDLQSRLDRPSRRFRPPTPGELLRFTEEYTIPTVIAVLEANVRALELLQRVLRLADPVRAADAESTAARRRADDLRRDAADGLSDALSELRTALSEADLPEDAESRSIVEDARELSAEIDRLIEESRGSRSGTRRPDRGRRARGGRASGTRDDGEAGSDGGGPVSIEVTDEGDRRRTPDGRDGSHPSPDRGSADAPTGSDRDGSDGRSDTDVDVEAELRSIKEDLEGDGSDGPAGSDDAGSDASDGEADGRTDDRPAGK
jgi:hypothetical protein